MYAFRSFSSPRVYSFDHGGWEIERWFEARSQTFELSSTWTKRTTEKRRWACTKRRVVGVTARRSGGSVRESLERPVRFAHTSVRFVRLPLLVRAKRTCRTISCRVRAQLDLFFLSFFCFAYSIRYRNGTDVREDKKIERRIFEKGLPQSK